MNVFREGDEVLIRLKKPYTITEIRDQGCHPDIDGKKGVIASESYFGNEGSYLIKLDEPMKPHKWHKNTDYDKDFTEYIETEDSLELR